jgi:hypothetical protein
MRVVAGPGIADRVSLSRGTVGGISYDPGNRGGSETMAAKRTKSNRWVSKVKTVSTYPPEGTFTKDAETIARIMARKDVSPMGIGSAVRIVQYFINRAGKGLEPERKRELEKAKQILRSRGSKKA